MKQDRWERAERLVRVMVVVVVWGGGPRVEAYSQSLVMFNCMDVCVCVCVPMCACMHAHVHECMHACIHAYICMYVSDVKIPPIGLSLPLCCVCPKEGTIFPFCSPHPLPVINNHDIFKNHQQISQQ